MDKSVDTIKDFLEWRGPKGEKPEEYDFKRNMYGYYRRYEENVKKKLGDQAYKEFMDDMPYRTGEKSYIEEWLSFRTADAKWIEDKRFDCDNSNTTCILTRLIYVLLWNWGAKNEDKPSQPLMAFEDKKFGGDTMNSFATTFNEYMRVAAQNVMFTEKIAKMFSETGKEFWQEEIGKEFWEKWDKFARNTHCIGNFVLVPYYFNGGRYGKTKDYWDLSLDLLRNNDGENMDLIADEKKQINWSKKDFNRYINVFFLWDYVKCEDLDENGNPKPRWLFDRKRKGSLLPQEQIDFQNFLDNVNKRIERRSQFMVAMLKIATGVSLDRKSEYEYRGEKQSEWKEWTVSGIYKEFMERIFMKDEIYAGYGEVIDLMKKVADEILQKDSDRKWIDSIMDDLSDLRKDMS